jgi:transmembrane sensor
MSTVTGFTNTQKIKEEAAHWLLKLDENTSLSPKDELELRQWIATSDVHRQTIIRMGKTWSDMDVLTEVMAPPEAARHSKATKSKAWLITALFSTVYFFKSLMKLVYHSIFQANRNRLALASIVVICFVSVVTWQTSTPEQKPSNTFATAIGVQAKHVLDDGSILSMNSNTRVVVHYTKDFRRIRLLQGEAYFDVEKDATRPFEVFAGDRLIRAIGTSFSVYRLADRIEVLVSEGKVELAIVDETLVITPEENVNKIKSKNLNKNSQPKNELGKVATQPHVITQSHKIGELEAGQRISIPAVSNIALKNGTDDVVELEVGEVSRKLSWLDGKLVFAGESLEEVVREISRHTSIRIDVPDPVLRKMRIGGHFRTGETDALFHVLESGFGIQVKKLDENHIELNAKE